MKEHTPFHALLNLLIRKQIRSYEAVSRNNWNIKFSIYEGNVLLLFVSEITNQSIVRFFIDEDEACEFINFIISQNASKFVA